MSIKFRAKLKPKAHKIDFDYPQGDGPQRIFCIGLVDAPEGAVANADEHLDLQDAVDMRQLDEPLVVRYHPQVNGGTRKFNGAVLESSNIYAPDEYDLFLDPSDWPDCERKSVFWQSNGGSTIDVETETCQRCGGDGVVKGLQRRYTCEQCDGSGEVEA